MICPFCKYENIPGEESCENCGEDLADLDGISLRRGIERNLIEDTIARLHPKQAVVLGKEDSVADAVKKMNNGRMGCVVVVDRDEVIGILTERDVLYRLLGKRQDLSKISLGSVMTPRPETLAPNDCIAYALNKMSVGGFRHIPIVTEQGLHGIISIRDILRYLTERVDS